MQKNKSPLRKISVGVDRIIKESGEILSTQSRTRAVLNKPNFILLMQNDNKYKLTGNEYKVLTYLAENCPMYSDNSIFIVKALKAKMSATLSLDTGTISNIISGLTRSGWLIKLGGKGRAYYKVNESFSWKGSLKSMESEANKETES